MKPVNKIKWLIIKLAADWDKRRKQPEYPLSDEEVESLYNALAENDEHWDAKNEVRCSGIETELSSEYSRHYESQAVARQMPDGTWVGWTYWYGGGKFGQAETVDWMEYAYDVACKEEEKMVVVRTFSLTNSA